MKLGVRVRRCGCGIGLAILGIGNCIIIGGLASLACSRSGLGSSSWEMLWIGYHPNLL